MKKYFNISAIKQKLIHSNPLSTVGVMNFQKWELFSPTPFVKVLRYVVCLKYWLLGNIRHRWHCTLSKFIYYHCLHWKRDEIIVGELILADI